jgi:hypothetical protein
MSAFDYSLDFRNTDFRKHPERYRMGKGEQGVLLVEPYKSELLPHWRFRTPDVALASAQKLYGLFLGYRDAGDFAGMDMARKFLQMGYTRSRRYANHASGQKYKGAVPDDKKGQSGAHGRPQLPPDPDPVKAASARIFYEWWQRAAADPVYKEAIAAHKKQWKAQKK